MTTEKIIIDSGSNGFGMDYPVFGEKKELFIKHNAGFFSCSTIALQDIVIAFRNLQRLPDNVDRSYQYAHYKHQPLQNLIPFFFDEKGGAIPFKGWFDIGEPDKEFQFSDYKKINFEAVQPFIDKYFTPSQHVLDIVKMYEEKYQIDYENTCGVFYRGNDKHREVKIAPYDKFIQQSSNIYSKRRNNMYFFVLPDEEGFSEEFKAHFRHIITPEELPICQNKDSAMFFELPTEERAEYGAKFLAAVIVMSKCKHLITHSGNCSLWAVLYRGNADNVHQWQHDKWI